MSTTSTATLTFTYGDSRTDLLKKKSCDLLDARFRRNFGASYFVFHNSPQEYIDRVVRYCLPPQGGELISVAGSYTKCFEEVLLRMKSAGIERIVFLQDDVFSLQKCHEYYDGLAKFLMETDIAMINLEYGCSHFSGLNIIESHNQFNAYGARATDFSKTLWGMDDGPYCANLDFLLTTVYSARYFSAGDIWTAEEILRDECVEKNILRCVLDRPSFRRVNIVGPNSQNKESEELFLRDNFDFSVLNTRQTVASPPAIHC